MPCLSSSTRQHLGNGCAPEHPGGITFTRRTRQQWLGIPGSSCYVFLQLAFPVPVLGFSRVFEALGVGESGAERGIVFRIHLVLCPRAV